MKELNMHMNKKPVESPKAGKIVIQRSPLSQVSTISRPGNSNYQSPQVFMLNDSENYDPNEKVNIARDFYKNYSKQSK